MHASSQHPCLVDDDSIKECLLQKDPLALGNQHVASRWRTLKLRTVEQDSARHGSVQDHAQDHTRGFGHCWYPYISSVWHKCKIFNLTSTIVRRERLIFTVRIFSMGSPIRRPAKALSNSEQSHCKPILPSTLERTMLINDHREQWGTSACTCPAYLWVC